MSKFSIKQIFRDHWDSFLALGLSIRAIVITEVERMMSCGEPEMGYAYYQCPHCGKYRFVPFRCHSRFCNTCGVAYQADRAEVIEEKLLNCRHRHVVFTIPQELREYFRKDRSLLDILFKSAAQVISSHLYEQNHTRNLTAGMVCGLHTFGRDLKWNPHIHMILTEGAVDCNEVWKDIHYFDYKMLRMRWQTVLLKNLEKALDPEMFDIGHFKNLKSELYDKKNNGFYVNAPRSDFNNAQAVAKYITRYISRPAMAQSRITGYDGTNVTYWYQRHEDNKMTVVTEHAHEFMKKLIIHIPEKGFNMLRYYGIYAKGNDAHPELIRRIRSSEVKKIRRTNLQWRYSMQICFGKDPLQCECGHSMLFEGIYHPSYTDKPPPYVVQSA